MPRINFDNLGTVGVIKDTEATELPHNAWTDSANVRFTNRGVEKFTGHEEIYQTAVEAPYFAISSQVGADYFWFYNSLANMFITDGVSHGTITASTGSADAQADINWTGGVLGGGIVIMNNGIREPWQWTGSGLTDQYAGLANWPAGMIARTLRPFKQTLVAADIDEGSGRNGTLIRWSNSAAVGAVPSSWDYTDTSSGAGRESISQGGGYIVDMATLRDINIIYKEGATWLMQFVGGNAQYAFRRMFEQIGIFSRRCVRELFGQHIVLGNNDVFMHDGQVVTQFLANKWRKWLFNEIDGDYASTSFIAINHEATEVWICYPETGQTLPNKALCWNWKDNTAYVRELPNGTAHIADGIIDVGSRTIDGLVGTIDSQIGINDQQTYSSAKKYLLMCNVNQTKFFKADSTQQFDGSNMTAYAHREALPIAGVSDDRRMRKIDIEALKYITEVWPIIKGTIGGIVNIYIGTRDNLDDTLSWNGPFPYTIGTTRKIDCRVMGKIIDIKFESTSNIEWQLYSYGLEVRVGGVR